MESFRAYIVVGENLDRNRWEYLQTMNVIDGLWDTSSNPGDARLFADLDQAVIAKDFVQDPAINMAWFIKEVSVLVGIQVA